MAGRMPSVPAESKNLTGRLLQQCPVCHCLIWEYQIVDKLFDEFSMCPLCWQVRPSRRLLLQPHELIYFISINPCNTDPPYENSPPPFLMPHPVIWPVLSPQLICDVHPIHVVVVFIDHVQPQVPHHLHLICLAVVHLPLLDKPLDTLRDCRACYHTHTQPKGSGNPSSVPV